MMQQIEKIFCAIGAVGDDLIARADEPVKRQPLVWRKWAALAACCVLVIGAAAWIVPMFRAGTAAPETMNARSISEPTEETQSAAFDAAQQPAVAREASEQTVPLTLEVQPLTLTRTSASFTLTNLSGQQGTLAGGYTLQMEKAGVWTELPLRAKLAVEHSSSFDESFTLVCDWTARYAELTAGHYRLVQPVTLADGSAYTLYAEFTIEE